MPFVTEDQVFSCRLHLSTASVQPNFTLSTELICLFGNSLDDITFFVQTPQVPCSLQGNMQGHPIILEILQHVFHLHKAGKYVRICWVPGHTSLPGNEAAEAATKEAILLRN
jgi:hypothetical protein